MKPFQATFTPPHTGVPATVLVIAVCPGTGYVPSSFFYITADGTPGEATLSYFSHCTPEWPCDFEE